LRKFSIAYFSFNLTDIVPLFSNFSDLDKFFFIFRSNDYDINMCCIKGISKGTISVNF
jgi:hypothetical protein